MRHVTIAGKSFLVGDEAADTLVRYAALLGKVNTADHVNLRSIGVDGEIVDANYLLNSATVMMSEGTASTLPEPDNSDALAYMQERIEQYETYSLPDDEPSEEG